MENSKMQRAAKRCPDRFPMGLFNLQLGMLLSVVAVAASYTTSVNAEVLVTQEESGRPPDLTRDRDIFRGPTIRLLSPLMSAGTLTSPFPLQLSFVSHAGAQVDLNSLVVTYKKLPPANVTDRVKPFANPNGISMPLAQVPPGDHTFVVEVRDTAGRKGGLIFSISVTK
jgi:hypothetical protein